VVLIALAASLLVTGGPSLRAAAVETASISGTVVGSGTPNVALANANVSVLLANGNWAGSASTDASGNFTLAGVTAGTYTVKFQPAFGANYVPQYLTNKSSLADAEFFTVTAGQSVTGKNAVLAVGASISGTVLGQGTPDIGLEGASVSVSSSD
jgi:hypothetical protein